MTSSDPVTLVAALLAVMSVATVIWLLIAAGMRECSSACLCLAGANALQALALVLRWMPESQLHTPALVSHGLLLGAFALLHLSVPLMDEQPTRWPLLLAALAIVVALLTQLPTGPSHVTHHLVVNGTGGLLCFLAARNTARLLRARELRPAICLIFGLPFIVIGGLLLARPLATLWMPDVPASLDTRGAFNGVWLWTALVMTLTVNGTLAFLLMLKLVLQIRRLTLRDPLTDALNRRAMAEAMAAEHQRVRRGHTYALVLLDMDRFKQLNDTLGHAAGDAALKTLVDLLKPCLREVDLLGRLGGEEFCALLPYTGVAGAALVAERMRHLLERSEFQWNGQSWPLSASFGITESVPGDSDPTEVLRRADEALYRAKAQGRNLVQAVEAADQRPRPVASGQGDPIAS
ncbi:GGDEF domain-containing protein [Roseateles depolymerans]|uniref:GGDEF domain-containing protein n=1 Tax=Roseateles depolymerans TaxID=76731 RepID=UPI00073DB200|nr:GGDEF domain-containing protein [Roseateles depolymerans]REG15274.1 diguanylate cyclase (GGDEF)-like protein [Roseateles depolymerans]